LGQSWNGKKDLAPGCISAAPNGVDKQKRREMSKQAMRDETERLVKEALERKTVVVKQGQTRIETKCGKCGAPNRVSADPGQVRVSYTCKEMWRKTKDVVIPVIEVLRTRTFHGEFRV
jgi:hypothetical protein